MNKTRLWMHNYVHVLPTSARSLRPFSGVACCCRPSVQSPLSLKNMFMPCSRLLPPLCSLHLSLFRLPFPLYILRCAHLPCYSASWVVVPRLSLPGWSHSNRLPQAIGDARSLKNLRALKSPLVHCNVVVSAHVRSICVSLLTLGPAQAERSEI